MCIAVPIKIIYIDGYKAIGEIEGIRKEINLRLTPTAEVGDYVLLHAGFSVHIMDPKLAQEDLDSMRKSILEEIPNFSFSEPIFNL